MTRKSTKQTKQQAPSNKRRFWKASRQEPSRKALLSFARVGLLGTQYV